MVAISYNHNNRIILSHSTNKFTLQGSNQTCVDGQSKPRNGKRHRWAMGCFISIGCNKIIDGTYRPKSLLRPCWAVVRGHLYAQYSTDAPKSHSQTSLVGKSCSLDTNHNIITFTVNGMSDQTSTWWLESSDDNIPGALYSIALVHTKRISAAASAALAYRWLRIRSEIYIAFIRDIIIVSTAVLISYRAQIHGTLDNLWVVWNTQRFPIHGLTTSATTASINELGRRGWTV